MTDVLDATVGSGSRWLTPLRGRHGPTGLLLAAPLVLLLLVVGYPMWVLLQQSVSGPLGWNIFLELLASDVTRAVLLRTLLTAALVTFVCLVLGYPYAYLLTVASPLLRAVLIVLVVLPFWTSFTIRTLAWVVLLQDQGMINNTLSTLGLPSLSLIRNVTGVVIGMAHVMLPFAVLPLYAAMRRIDRRLVDAAVACGASRRAAWRQVYLPLSLPGIVAASVLVFILSLGFFITPQLLGSPRNALLSQLIYMNVTQVGDNTTASALGVLLVAVTLLLLVALTVIVRILPGRTPKGAR
ncbi:ABC transporter permease [Phytoactinopolyspora alkaliphila]|uniref:ABC transporter permease n=1 Tax=Phytoactinopolyspora alkaliphila TaxID=1783498 RepID=A0A6N9YKX9_9ACTN|nr:ABC transporter permease [Phytoactinopolyspora alkaliphila]NED95605.1 ABC transporter permease [Phytoactinopolyspora alkaliphila]